MPRCVLTALTAGLKSTVRLVAEYWSALWPNVFSLSIWTVLLFIWHHFSLKKHITVKHEELKAHITASTGQSLGDDLPSGNEEGF